ncbi:protein kinase domain-containing protein [Pendulispora albinea]|uniref:Protein kinase n=1 Tax=Pendulispora albinea TaxID=2741071 RepID=A0ABZ2LU77_9BACT
MSGSRDAEAPSVFADRFEIEEEAGRGGMGIVYRAFDRVTQATVALKVLHKTEPSTVRRFAMEADALGRIEHPDIVRYLAHGIADGGAPYLAIEWLEGESLRVRLARVAENGGRLDLADVLEMGRRLAGALAAAHSIGIVHRDVKPSNILLVKGELVRPKLVDFGIVRATSAQEVTTSGTVLGTVGYMAPEQARGAEDLDGRADLYSLGCVLFRCLANRDVFDGPDPVTVLSMLLLHEPPRLAKLRPDVPPDLDALIARLLSKDREKRPVSATAVKLALERIAGQLLGTTLTSRRSFDVVSKSEPPPLLPVSERAPKRLRRVLALAGAVMVTWALILGFAYHRRKPAETEPVAAPVGTLMTALPVSPLCTPRGAALLQQALQTMREGRWDGARRLFDEAMQADGACPQIRFRRFAGAAGSAVVPIAVQREHFRDAMRIRDVLSERDRMLMDALAPLVAEDMPHYDEANRLLDEAVQKFPMDAELLVLSAIEKMTFARNREDLELALDRTRKAAGIDPAYSDAWQLQARALDFLGRDEEKRVALDHCLKASPGSVDCMDDRILLLRRLGQCEEATAEARRHTSWDREESSGFSNLAINLAATQAPREAIEEVLLLRWQRLPPALRERTRLFETAKLEIWAGNFDAALRTAEQLEAELAGSGALEPHWSASMLSVEALLETGNVGRASRVAEQAFRRKDAWTRDNGDTLNAAESEAWLLAAELHGGRITPGAWRKATDAWDKVHAPVLNDFERWVFRWGNAVATPADAAEALALIPADQNDGRPRYPNGKWRVGLLDAFAGRVHLLAGDEAKAAHLLERGAHACHGLDYPALHMRAHLWLGMAKEKLGDTTAACDAYRVVVDRWGHATPPSVTAREADRRSHALACKRH